MNEWIVDQFAASDSPSSIATLAKSACSIAQMMPPLRPIFNVLFILHLL